MAKSRVWSNVTVREKRSGLYDKWTGEPIPSYQIVAEFNGVELRGDEKGRIACVVDAKRAFPGWEDA
jgi:hypothetical protein